MPSGACEPQLLVRTRTASFPGTFSPKASVKMRDYDLPSSGQAPRRFPFLAFVTNLLLVKPPLRSVVGQFELFGRVTVDDCLHFLPQFTG